MWSSFLICSKHPLSFFPPRNLTAKKVYKFPQFLHVLSIFHSWKHWVSVWLNKLLIIFITVYQYKVQKNGHWIVKNIYWKTILVSMQGIWHFAISMDVDDSLWTSSNHCFKIIKFWPFSNKNCKIPMGF